MRSLSYLSGPRKWARTLKTGSLIIFIHKGNAKRAAAKLLNKEYHDLLFEAAVAELGFRQTKPKS